MVVALKKTKMKQLLLLMILLCSCKEHRSHKKTLEKSVETDSTTIVKLEKPNYNFDKNFVLGKFNYKKDTTFTKVEENHASKPLYLKKEAYSAFVKMYNSAKTEGVRLKIVSGTRNFYQQKAIWERKWEKHKNLPPTTRALKILEFSSMPSTSRHHWGTDIDLNNLENSYFETRQGKKIYDWLVNNAHKYGFYQVYTSKENGRTGYNLEKWHWSYLPLSKTYLKYYNDSIVSTDITGFKGAYLAKELDIINNYVNGIN